MYWVGNISYSEKSPINKKIISIFLRRELKACITPLVEYVFDTATDMNGPPFTTEDIICEEEVLCPHCGSKGLEEVHIEDSMVEPEYDPLADPEDQFTCPLCGTRYPTQDEAKRCCVGQIAYQCQDCGEILTADEYDVLANNFNGDILDWYLVGEELGKALIRIGESVIQSDSFYIWGRKISSLEIEEEPCFAEICEALEILDGQKYSWAKHLKG